MHHALHLPQVIMHCNRHWLDAIYFLHGLDETCLVRLAMSMRPRVFSPNEVAPQRFLYVLQRGLVLYGGRVLTQGMPWGDDVILTDKRYFVPFLARAMTYVDVQCIAREELLDIVSAFPDSYKRLRKSAIKLALRRHLIEAARWVKEMGKDPQLALQGDFVDRVHTAAGTGRQHQESAQERRNKSVNIAVSLDQDVRGGGTAQSGRGGEDDDGVGISIVALDEMARQQESARGALREEMRILKEALTRLWDARQGRSEAAPN